MPPLSEVVWVVKSESNVVLVKDRERKRHQDGTSSKSHHSKKFKEPMTSPNSDRLVMTPKSGSESCVCVTFEVDVPAGPARSGPFRIGLMTCNSYVDKV